jgi:hypothetical protein
LGPNYPPLVPSLCEKGEGLHNFRIFARDPSSRPESMILELSDHLIENRFYRVSTARMRKRLIIPDERAPSDSGALDVANLGSVEITSEDQAHPIENALQLRDRKGWRAAEPGPQVIRLLFDQPQTLSRIRLVFEETEIQRTQEFVLRWSADGGRSFTEIVRQQWNFSPPGTVRETEDYTVKLRGVTVLELRIVPDQAGGNARASLASLRLT